MIVLDVYDRPYRMYQGRWPIWLARGHWDGRIALKGERSWRTIIGIAWNTRRKNYWLTYKPRKKAS